jgi:CheY-like chemotaxis protein
MTYGKGGLNLQLYGLVCCSSSRRAACASCWVGAAQCHCVRQWVRHLVVCRLAIALGGTLEVSNRDDGMCGVSFRLYLPIMIPEHAVDSAPTGSRSLGPAAALGSHPPAQLQPGQPLSLHVLVADDSAMNRRIAARVLRSLGCTCTLAEDGDEVPAAVARETFDVLLLDINMARVNGDVAAAALRMGGYAGPIIAVTGNATGADAEAYRAAGFTSTLGKPFGPPEMRRCLINNVPGAGAPAVTVVMTVNPIPVRLDQVSRLV